MSRRSISARSPDGAVARPLHLGEALAQVGEAVALGVEAVGGGAGQGGDQLVGVRPHPLSPIQAGA